MSIVAEFARNLHESSTSHRNRSYSAIDYPSQTAKLYDIKAVIFDIYGTMVDYWHQEFSDKQKKDECLLGAFRKTSRYFQFTKELMVINPNESPEKTLQDFYHGLIALNHEKNLRKNISFPEIRIEEVWEIILMMVERHGYDWTINSIPSKKQLAKCMAYYYHFHSLGRRFYTHVDKTISALKNNNIKCGIISNAQFYTPIDLTLFLRDQSKGTIDDYRELFDVDFVYFSYEYGVAKPNQLLYRKLFDTLYEYHILPSQTVFVGNDLSSDIKPAQENGMMSAFFCGDSKSAFLHDLNGRIIPDICFTNWEVLPSKISFYESGKNNGSKQNSSAH